MEFFSSIGLLMKDEGWKFKISWIFKKEKIFVFCIYI